MPIKKKTTAKAPPVERMLVDGDLPLELRKQVLTNLLTSDEGDDALARLLAAAGKASGEDRYAAKRKELQQLLEQMMAGPLRLATFVRLATSDGLGQRAEVLFPEGGTALCTVPDADLAHQLRCGDTVLLEAQARAVLQRAPEAVEVGEKARLERRLPCGGVEVRLREERFVFRTSARLSDQLEGGEVDAGGSVLVCPQRMMAFRAIPEDDGLGRLGFLSTAGVPDVVVERDLGAPPEYIEQLSEHVRREMAGRALGGKYRIRRARPLLLTGVPGTGKTYSILALWNRLYAIMSEIVGVAVEELPQRVMQVKSSQLLDKWVGSSDRNIARFFDEVAALASETFVGPDGREHELPVLVICEEMDALARVRGEDAIHDRIQATLLDRLDGNLEVFRDKLVLLLFTTNTPDLVDPAALRRAGGRTVTFGRMDRWQLQAVLEKQLDRLPFRLAGAADRGEAQRRVVGDLVAWLHGPNALDGGVVEIAFAGRPNPVVKHRRDFLTAALIDRAVQEACDEACRAEGAGEPDPGLSTERLMGALDNQVRSVVEQLTPRNCNRYLTLPDDARVATVRRLPQPALPPFDLERAS